MSMITKLLHSFEVISRELSLFNVALEGRAHLKNGKPRKKELIK